MRMFAYYSHRLSLAAGIAASLLLPIGSICLAQAQQAPSSPAPADTTVTKLPEVTVIGEALPDPQSKPVSATFLSSSDIDAFRVREPQDIVRFAPNMSATDSGSRSFGDVYSTRGLTNTVFFGAPATTVYVDDVPFGETFSYAQQLSGLNSVEVLRGPQPTLVGRNTYGGLINVRSLRPTNVFEGSLNSEYGSFGASETDGYVMGPVNADGSLGFRLGGQYDEREGYLRNPFTGERVDREQHWGLNGGLFWQPAQDWEVSLTGGYDDYNDGAPRLTSLARTTGFYTVTSDVKGEQQRSLENEALRIAYDGSDYKFLAVTSRRSFDLSHYLTDLDFTSAPDGLASLAQTQQIWSQEFRFSNNDKASKWDWNVGAYGSLSEIRGVGLHSLDFEMPTTTLTTTVFPQAIPGVGTINLTANSVSQSLSAIALNELTVHQIDEKAFAFYGGAAWKGWDPVTLSAGARFDYVQRSIARDQGTNGLSTTNTVTTTTIAPVPGFPPFPAPPVNYLTTLTPINSQDPHVSMEDDWVHVTPQVGIDWKVNDNVLLYAKSTYAFKPGGFSAYTADPRFVPFKEEKDLASEMGVKSQWLDGRLTANLAWFYNSISNYQVERSITQTDYAVFNAARGETYGAEFETRYALCPQIDFLGSFGWTHARLTSYTDPVTGQSLNGVTPPFVPEFDSVVAAEYHLDCGFFARLEYVALGDTKFDDFNRAQFQQKSYGLLNASIGWRAKNWNISLYARNLTQEEYYTNMNAEIQTGAPGIPREFGVRVGVKF